MVLNEMLSNQYIDTKYGHFCHTILSLNYPEVAEL